MKHNLNGYHSNYPVAHNAEVPENKAAEQKRLLLRCFGEPKDEYQPHRGHRYRGRSEASRHRPCDLVRYSSLSRLYAGMTNLTEVQTDHLAKARWEDEGGAPSRRQSDQASGWSRPAKAQSQASKTGTPGVTIRGQS